MNGHPSDSGEVAAGSLRRPGGTSVPGGLGELWSRAVVFARAYVKSMRLYYSFITGIAGWLTTVSDASIRALDLQLLTDLLSVLSEAAQRQDLIQLIVSHVDDLVALGERVSQRLRIDL